MRAAIAVIAMMVLTFGMIWKGLQFTLIIVLAAVLLWTIWYFARQGKIWRSTPSMRPRPSLLKRGAPASEEQLTCEGHVSRYDDTVEIPIEYYKSEAEPSGLRITLVPYRKVIEDDGSFWLRVGIRGRKSTEPIHSRVRLDEGHLVNRDLAAMCDFIPLDGETTIHVLTRLRVVSFVFKFGFVAAVVASFGLAGALVALLWNHQDRMWVIAAAVGLLVAISRVYVYWMRWYYRYIVVTNLRLCLWYSPPFGLPGRKRSAFIEDIRGFDPLDMSWVYNQIFHCGTVAGETAATTTDDWIREGISHVPQHEDVANIVNQQRAKTKTGSLAD